MSESFEEVRLRVLNNSRCMTQAAAARGIFLLALAT